MIEIMLNYAMRFIGIPYVYGGNNPLTGMDCSGFVCECLKSIGVIESHRDFSARELFKLLSENNKLTQKVERGCVVFFGKSASMVSHVAIALSDKIMIESGGGDSSTISKERAANANAFVRIRPIRNDLVGIIKLKD